MKRARTPASARVMKHVLKCESGCWEFQGRKNLNGYGSMVDVTTGVRREALAHRASWEWHRGPIPAGMHVLHHCDNPPCVNPDHLFIGTNADNVRDRTAKGRSNRPTGEKNGRAKLTADAVAAIRALAGSNTRRALASKFNISKAQITCIVNNRQWIV